MGNVELKSKTFNSFVVLQNIQNFFSSLEVINEENKKHGSDCDDVDKNSFAWLRKFKPTLSFERKMFK